MTRSHATRRVVLGALALGIAVGPSVSAAAQSFTTIEYPGAMHTRVFGINPRGDIAGFHINLDGTFHGLLRAADGTLTSFDVPGAVSTVAIGINPRGDVVGFYSTTPGVSHGFLLSRGALTTIDFPGAVSTDALGIGASGDIVGNYRDSAGRVHGFHLRKGVFAAIDFPGATYTEAFQISPQGHIVGNYQIGAVSHEFLLADGVFTSIDFPGAAATGGPLFGVGINPEGAIVGQYRDTAGRTHGFLLEDGEFTSIDFPDPAAHGHRRHRHQPAGRHRGAVPRRRGQGPRLSHGALSDHANAYCREAAGLRGRGSRPASRSRYAALVQPKPIWFAV